MRDTKAQFMWQEVDNQLVRSFSFKDFQEAFTFMTRVAFIAERLNHHPNWTNVYNKVEISLSTHDEGNVVTERDHNFALMVDELLK